MIACCTLLKKSALPERPKAKELDIVHELACEIAVIGAENSSPTHPP